MDPRKRLIREEQLVSGLFVIFMFVLLPAHLSMAQENSVIWTHRHYPPYTIDEGEFKGQGYGDAALEIIKEYLPSYTHHKQDMNIARFIHEAKDLKNVCGRSYQKTAEREEVLYFSIPAEINLPHQIYINRGSFSKFQSSVINGKVSLESLLKNHPELKLGIEASRSYGLEKNVLLNKYKQTGSSIFERKAASSEGLIEMLLGGRLDYILEYPKNVSFYINNTEDMKSLYSWDVKEGFSVIPAYFVCAKSEAGKEVIDKINEALQKELPSKRYRTRAERWLDKKSASAYRDAYERILLKDLDINEK